MTPPPPSSPKVNKNVTFVYLLQSLKDGRFYLGWKPIYKEESKSIMKDWLIPQEREDHSNLLVLKFFQVWRKPRTGKEF